MTLAELIRWADCVSLAAFLVSSLLVNHRRRQPPHERFWRYGLWSLCCALFAAQLRAGLRRTSVDYLTWWIAVSLLVMAVGAALVRVDQQRMQRGDTPRRPT